MDSNEVWKLQKETQNLLKEVNREIKKIEDEMTSGVLLVDVNTSEIVMRKIAINTGKLEGLKFIRSKVSVQL